MATIRLTPSTYYLSNTSYLSISDAANMYNDTDNTTYATVTNSRTSTTSYYIYLRGFNFDDIPDGAVISSYTVKLKASESGGSTSTSYSPKLAGGTSTYSTASTTPLSTTASVHTFTSTATWSSIIDYGDEFGIRIDCRRASRNTTSYIYIYGAEIEVEYEIPVSCTVTSSLVGNGTIDPSGATASFEGRDYILTITPDNVSDSVSATKNGVDITNDIVAHYPGGTETKLAESYTTGGSIDSGESYLSYPVGYSAESPHTYTSNVYSSSGSTGYAIYSFDFSDIPSNATIESIEVRCSGQRENATVDSSHVAKVELYTGSTLKGDEENFTSTSSQVITVSNPGTWTRSELQDAKLRFTVGYYGGRLYGISWDVTYSIPGSNPEYYTYVYTVDGDATIVVTIGSAATDAIYVKTNGTYVAASRVWKKVSGSWVEQSDLTTVFQNGTNYVKGVV